MYRTFAPHFWSPEARDHTLFDRISVQSIKALGVTRYKIWLTHIQTNLPDMMVETGAYADPAYRKKALNFHAALGLPTEVEVCFPLPSQLKVLMNDLDFSTVEDNENAKKIGKFIANWHIETAFRPWTEKGGALDYLTLDGPFDKLLAGGMERDGLRTAQATSLAIWVYMAEIKNRYPKIKFIYLENLPLWKYNGYISQSSLGGACFGLPDLAPILDLFLKKTQEGPTCKFEFVEIDCPYPFYKLQKEKHMSFVVGMAKLGLTCDCIINSGSQLVDFSDESNNLDILGENDNYADVLNYAKDLKKAYNNRLPGLVCQTWSKFPKFVLPKTGASPLHCLAGNLAGINLALLS